MEQLKAFSTMHDKMLRDFINDLSSMLRKIKLMLSFTQLNK